MALNSTAVTSSFLPPVNSPVVSSPEAGVVVLAGSFQGNGATAVKPTFQRGSFFSTVTRVSAGIYQVQMNLNVPVSLVPATVTGNAQPNANGQPNGLLVEARAWVTSETNTNAGWAPPTVLACVCTSYDGLVGDTDYNTFRIYCYLNAAGVNTLTDAAATDRINFQLMFKDVATLP
jgi:hypothetical protein